MKKIVSVLLVLAVLSFSIFAQGGQEAAYPTRNINLVVPYNAGGTTDLTARALANGMAASLGVQINITKDDDTGKNCFEGIESVKLNDKKYIEENMFLLSDDENYEIHDDYVKLVQGKKSVVVPQTFTENEVKSKGITLRVRNYISFDKNDFPYVSCVRLLGFYPYNGGAE